MPEYEYKYILDSDGNPVPCSDVLEWARWLEENRQIALTEVAGCVVSTVFLGIDTSMALSRTPKMFQTVVFRNGEPTWHVRYLTRDHAIGGHEIACQVEREKGREKGDPNA